MQRASFASMECPIARAADQIGDGWSMLLLRNAFLGSTTFQDFEQRLEIPASTLTRRLKLLCEQGLMVRTRYRAHPPRDEYKLTDKGRDLLPVLLSMAAWGNRWLAPKGPPLVTVDAETGAEVEPVLVDRRSGRRLAAGDVALVPGPGASKRLRQLMVQPIVLGGQPVNQEAP
jgi:DNA-binding HxlR family transcriptional regulator